MKGVIQRPIAVKPPHCHPNCHNPVICVLHQIAHRIRPIFRPWQASCIKEVSLIQDPISVQPHQRHVVTAVAAAESTAEDNLTVRLNGDAANGPGRAELETVHSDEIACYYDVTDRIHNRLSGHTAVT